MDMQGLVFLLELHVYLVFGEVVKANTTPERYATKRFSTNKGTEIIHVFLYDINRADLWQYMDML